MKKILSLLLVATMILSLCACGGGESKENLLESAQEVYIADISNAIIDNMAKAIDDYVGKPLKITGRVSKIEKDYFVLSENHLQYGINVYLPKEDLKELTRDDVITVVGTLKNIVDKSEFPIYYYDSDMKNGFIVDWFINKNKVRHLTLIFYNNRC